MINFNFFKIDVKITISALVALITVGFFSMYVAAIYACSLGFVFLHELGHAFAAKFFKLNVYKIEINFIGGFTKLQLSNDTKKNILISLSGVLVNLIFAYLFLFCFYVTESQFIYYIAMCNVVLVFNLIPMAPFDGFRVVKGILYYYKIDYFSVDSLINLASFCFITFVFNGLSDLVLLFAFFVFGSLWVSSYHHSKLELKKKITSKINYFLSSDSLVQRLKDYSLLNEEDIVSIIEKLYDPKEEINRLIDFYITTAEDPTDKFINENLWKDIRKTFDLFRKEKIKYLISNYLDSIANSLYPEPVLHNKFCFFDLDGDYCEIEKYREFFYRNSDVDDFFENFINRNELFQEIINSEYGIYNLETVIILKLKRIFCTMNEKISGVISRIGKNNELLLRQILMIMVIESKILEKKGL